ncbi:bacillithiol system redox-active protein YtxJ [Flavobacterium sp. xlx-214]|uniref:bacillithiol system redox-active protein YtxJ n=1 Tax=unclassified Flavobacterium TaxID=196869 RepID=UPI0013D8367F|nr:MULTISPECIES: bacillithiol system redox-active protein YtxJ [unclassified Flavobacterium]MBA5792293.1 bacillithiol system redox-active protein YtxJ [Flavobacterium sp. xlx-221]QMI82390.1 bacillithiol system redox-active protein YtxJ [Flavobacterium sp. xlx-214]
MNWKTLEHIDQIKVIKDASFSKLQLIFKHSTRCIISKMALKNFESDFNLEDTIDAYYLDLIAHRNISNEIAETFQVQHQSPQILLIKNGGVVYNESHEGIDANVLVHHL